MRCVLALSLLITLCASADAATVHRSKPSTVHSRTRQYVIVVTAKMWPPPPGWYKFPGYPLIPPEENRNLDSSNFGGG